MHVFGQENAKLMLYSWTFQKSHRYEISSTFKNQSI